jgi:hypothetical protein
VAFGCGVDASVWGRHRGRLVRASRLRFPRLAWHPVPKPARRLPYRLASRLRRRALRPASFVAGAHVGGDPRAYGHQRRPICRFGPPDPCHVRFPRRWVSRLAVDPSCAHSIDASCSEHRPARGPHALLRKATRGGRPCRRRFGCLSTRPGHGRSPRRVSAGLPASFGFAGEGAWCPKRLEPLGPHRRRTTGRRVLAARQARAFRHYKWPRRPRVLAGPLDFRPVGPSPYCPSWVGVDLTVAVS